MGSKAELIQSEPVVRPHPQWLGRVINAFGDPIDGGSHTEHRLLITTRIRDLVPKATRVELPLMEKDEAVALLLDLAGVEQEEYTKDNPRSEWPPPAGRRLVVA